ncbi:DOXA2 factor, partial [Oreotrochilus melanogaster]|nr:DOXA2 factor [Oreotrochilus melanogaster]
LFDGVYPFYLQQRKAAVFDVSIIIVIVVFLTFACSFLLIIPGIRGWARLYWTLRVLLSLVVGVVIVAMKLTPAPEAEEVAHLPDLSLGLRCSPRWGPCREVLERVSQEESGHRVRHWGSELTHSWIKGVDAPQREDSSWCIAESFSCYPPPETSSELLQMTCSCNYPRPACCSVGVAFCTWLISNMLFSMPVPVYGGYMLLVTGAFMIFSLLSFSTVRNSLMCPIHFGTSVLHTGFGGSFWLTLAIGLLCFLAGVTVVTLHYFSLDLLKTFFDLREDRVEEYQEMMTEVYVTPHFLNKEL